MSSSPHNLFSVAATAATSSHQPASSLYCWGQDRRVVVDALPAGPGLPALTDLKLRGELSPSRPYYGSRSSEFWVLSSELHRNGNYLLLFVSRCGIFCAVMGGVFWRFYYGKKSSHNCADPPVFSTTELSAHCSSDHSYYREEVLTKNSMTTPSSTYLLGLKSSQSCCLRRFYRR